MAVDGESGAGSEDIAIAFDSTPSEDAASTREPPRAARLVLVAAAVGVLAVTLWSVLGDDGGSPGDGASESAASEEPDPGVGAGDSPSTAVSEEVPSVLTLSNIVVSAHDGGTELLTLDLGGPAPSTLVSGAPSLDRVPDHLLGLVVQRSPDPLLMCDATHGWGTTAAIGAVTLTLPRAWFEVADGHIDVAMGGDASAKIIVCALAGGGPVEITIHGPATLDDDEIDIAETDEGLRIRLGPEPSFDATEFADEYAALVDGLEIFRVPDPSPAPALAAPYAERLSERGGDPNTLRHAHVAADSFVMVWLGDATETPLGDVGVVVCIGLGDETSLGSSCQTPAGALAGNLAISVIDDQRSRSVHLATAAQLVRAAALELPIDRGVVLVDLPTDGDRPPDDLDTILTFLEGEAT